MLPVRELGCGQQQLPRHSGSRSAAHKSIRVMLCSVSGLLHVRMHIMTGIEICTYFTRICVIIDLVKPAHFDFLSLFLQREAPAACT